jgi:pilus assembly protein Flp/PilA
MRRFTTLARAFVEREDGATMVEYALMLALIAIICVGAVQALGISVNVAFSSPPLAAAL